ncbi:DEAD/DEAH box helicase [Marmoricola sp. URHB0036]|uniref:DEAD/DEAH box helicase n=1 Tax=Marmoricola sp. URHB0036 TaxID=1298863 RepID=UPI000415DD52|nr:DEAD/DEAH box helicase [Marmoricola sp. URHB0036]
MSELLPTTQAPRVQQSILDYLATTFSLADEEARAALVDLLQDRENGIFKGPYLRVRLPFRPAEEGWRESLGWHEGYPPYGHQAAAFQRLSSLDLGPDKTRPLPTLVTTGTGSGKTEAFLHPILDHVVRAKQRGVTGTKAVVVYPMNALANDQAGRLAGMITQHQQLSGITAALYTGQQGATRSRVSRDGLITDRYVIRRQAPDILLTNYKMLDQLLLREADQQIWTQSATSLQYLVLDEFHTYDGAQGTDVAMLLRRLGMALKSHWPEDAFTAADRARPLGIVTPVATSATLGDKGDPAAMLDFARTVFGEDFEPDSVVTETRLGLDEWLGEPATSLVPRTDRSALELAVETGSQQVTGRLIAERVLSSLFADADGAAPMLAGASAIEMLDLVKAHPLTRSLVEAAEQAVSLAELVDRVLLSYAADEASRATAEQVLLLWSAVLSHVRKEVGLDALSVDLHLWVRELSRIDRRASGTPDYLWSDDRHLTHGEEGAGGVQAFPAVYCRHCGRSGWAVLRAPIGGFDLTGADPDDVRRARILDDREFRALIHAPVEAEQGNADPAHDPDEPRLMWLHAEQRQVLPTLPADDAELAEGRALPVLAHAGPRAGDLSRDDTCPSCLQKDGIRFLGSAVATLLSVSLSTIFGGDDLDQAEKKSLVFTDSVQDAAHRAGFVQSRSHRLTLRAVVRAAVGDDPVSLDQAVERVLTQAGDDKHRRYRILPPEHADRDEFAPFWKQERQRRVPPAVMRRVRKRLLLDLVLEVGLQSRLGRTLELTGSLAAQVEASRATLLRAVSEVEKVLGEEHVQGLGVTDEDRVRWVRGVLERMRTDGAVQHEWFRRFQAEDGRRYSIWGGRPATDGMPAFPRGRPAPAYPRVGGGGSSRDTDLVPAASARSWYAVWTARALGCAPVEGASLVVQLLKQLAALDVVQVVNTQSGAQVYEVLPSRVLVQPVDDVDLADGAALLACDTCGALHPGTPQVVDELEGAPCQVLRCRGALVRASGDPDNFYRRLYAAADTTRVIAREHTSLLPDETRLAYEAQFKAGASNPAAPNVLVATPTLEMGIDIGDLSTVMLAGLPRSVASYLQRVGRAGRLTGSALNLAFVSGRGEQLPRLGDPLSVVNGAVRPPATYLDAEEILRRQYLASVADALARKADAPHPTTPTHALGSIEPGSFLHALATAAEEAGARDAFLAGFEDLSATAREGLKQWTTPGPSTLTSPMAVFLHEQRHRWASRIETFQHRITEIQAELPDLQQRAGLPAATEDDKLALRTAEAGLGLVRKQLADLRDSKRNWIQVLEEHGILPSYTLVDDTVSLDVTISWLDPDGHTYHSDEQSFHRASALALRDLAPGATFYANRHQLLVDAVDLGHQGEAVRTWALCAACGHGQPRDEGGQPPTTCPRCGDPTIADVRQSIDVVELTSVSSAVRREEATIDDGRDDRVRAGFQVVTAADVGTPRTEWHVEGYPLGVKHLHGMTIRWLNLGRTGEPSSGTLHVAGQEHAAPLFRVCARCGKVDTGTRRNAATEHRPWCPQRHATDEDVQAVALSRTLVTEGVVVRLPATVTLGDRFALPSLAAAVQLGLREHLGGNPDHLAVEQVVDPFLSNGSDNRDGLLVHDVVPGGTGYLAELSEPQKLWSVLRLAWLVVRDCPCQDEDRAACHRCLSPWINGPSGRYVSRLAAERHLHDMLTAAGALDEPEEALGWTVVAEPTAAADPETHIEQRFRSVLRERLVDGLGASVGEHPGPHGNRWTVVLGGRTWTLEPQLPLGNVKPDFVLVCNDPGVPRVAVFCDGWQFHASPAVNRLAEDAGKRAALRAQGYVVVSLTWHDLDVAEQRTSDPAPWFDDARWSKVLAASNGTLRPVHRGLVTGGPLDLLMGWIAAPDPVGLRELAEHLPLLLIGSGAAGRSDAAESLLTLSGDLHDGGPVPSTGDAATWSWRHDTLTVVARRTTGNASEVAVLLDDRKDLLGPPHKEAWNEWLRLSNLLNLRLQEASVLARSQLHAPSAAVGPATTATEGGPATTTYAEPWRSLLDQAVGETASVLLRQLAGLAVTPPEVGGETGDGLVLEIAWPHHRLVVDLDLSDDDRLELADLGWRVVPPDSGAIQDALEPAGAP